MRLVHLIQRYPPAVGGSETWCRRLAEEQARRGHRVRVLTLDIVGEQEFWEEPTGDGERFRLGGLDQVSGVEVRRFRRSLPVYTVHHLVLRLLLDRLLGIFFLGPHSRELVAGLEAEMRGADVVHLHTLPYPHVWFGLRAARRLGIPVVLTPHFHAGHRDYERRHQYRWMRRADALVVISEDERRHLTARGIPPERVTVTGVGIAADGGPPPDREECRRQLREALGLSGAAAVITCVARKVREKGIETLVHALQRLSRDGREVGLVLAGPGFPWFDAFMASLPGELRARILDRGVVSDSEKRKILAGADVFAMPSRYEAFGIVFLEAWEAGLPVVAGAHGAQPGVIGGGGTVVPFGDVEATAAAIADFLDHPDAARTAVRRGRAAIAARYRWDRIAEQVLEIDRRLAPARSLKIAFGSNFFPPRVQGGAEIAMARQVGALAAVGHHIEVLAGALDETRQRHTLHREEGDIPVQRLVLHREDLSAEFGNHANPAAVAAFGRLLDRMTPDVVHLHNLAGMAAEMIHDAADVNLPVVMTLHDYWGICVRNTLVRVDGTLCTGPGMACGDCLPALRSAPPQPTPVRNAALQAALARVDLFISPSRFLADRFVAAGVPAQRLRVVPNGIQLDRFDPGAPLLEDAPFLYLGYLGAHKGVATLIEALAHAEAGEATLLLAGDGEGRAALQEQVQRLGVAHRVSFLGALPNDAVPALLARCRGLVVPSLWPENAPVTIVEAMAAGRPVIASAVGGIPELVEDGVTGLLVPRGDAAALAGALAELRGDARAGRLGAAARRRAEESYGLEAAVTRLEQLYRELLDRPRPRRPSGPGRPVIAVDGEEGAWLAPAVTAALRQTETEAGAFHLVPWSASRPGAVDRRFPGPADVLLVTGGAGTGTAAEALALGVPFAAIAAAGSPLARLAADSGAGVVGEEARALGRRLGRLLRDGAERRNLAGRGLRFAEAVLAFSDSRMPRAGAPRSRDAGPPPAADGHRSRRPPAATPRGQSGG